MEAVTLLPRVVSHVKSNPVGTAAIALAASGFGYLVSRITASDNRVPNTEALAAHPLLERAVYEVHKRRDINPQAVDEIVDSFDRYVFYAENALKTPSLLHANAMSDMLFKMDRFYYRFINSNIRRDPQRMYELMRGYQAGYKYIIEAFHSRMLNKLRDQGMIAYRIPEGYRTPGGMPGAVPEGASGAAPGGLRKSPAQ